MGDKKVKIPIIDLQSFDKDLAYTFNEVSLSFFTEIDNLLQKSFHKNREVTKKLVSLFLNLPPIKRNFEQELPLDSKSSVKKLFRRITNSFHNARYFIGLIIGLLDLLSDKMESNIANYFFERNSYIYLFYRNGKYNNKRIRSSLLSYASKPKCKKNLSSIKKIFERHFLKTHKELLLNQESFDKEIDYVKLIEKKTHFSTRDLKKILNVYSTLFARFKLVVSKEYYSHSLIQIESNNF